MDQGSGPDEAKGGLRALKKRRTREAMHRAAVELVAEHGIAHVTTEMIAERAGVSSRTFFNYWSSKEDAVLGLVVDSDRRSVALLRERPAGEDPVVSLRVVMREMASHVLDDAELRAAKRRVFEREPRLKQMSGRAMAALQTELSAALEVRLEADGAADARARALILVQFAFAVARAAFALSMENGTALPVELEGVYARIDAGDVGL